MINLILNILIAHNEYDDAIHFTEEEILELIKKYDIVNKKEYNALGSLLLYEKSLITYEDFMKSIDLSYEDNGTGKKSVYLYINDFDEILKNDRKYSTMNRILNDDIDDMFEPYDTDFDISYYLDDFTNDTMTEIINYLIKNDCVYTDDNDEEIIISKENTKIDGKFIYINDSQDDWIKMDEDVIKDNFDELYTNIQRSIADAQRDADISYIYDKTVKEFENAIGYFQRITKKKKKYNRAGQLEEIDGEVIKIQLKYFNFDELKDDLKSTLEFRGIYNFLEETESYLSIGIENDWFDCDTLDYDRDYSGTIDNKDLNSIIVDILSWN
ncbi:hypothetical protein M0Q50_01920 [bacterium]|jgi:hypothetical protein|nr:hypothetical protein [bacterium]